MLKELKLLEKNFQSFKLLEDKLVGMSDGEELVLARKIEQVWQKQDSLYDSIVGITGVLEVDVHNKASIDESVVKELTTHMRKAILEDLQIDFQWAAEHCLDKIESKNIVVLKEDSDEMSVLNMIMNEEIYQWLNGTGIEFFSDMKIKMNKIKDLHMGYPDLKRKFDDYIKAILPVYKQVLFSEAVSAEVAMQRQAVFLENLDYLKNISVRQSRNLIPDKMPIIDAEKLTELFSKILPDVEAVCAIINK